MVMRFLKNKSYALKNKSYALKTKAMLLKGAKAML